MGRKSHARIGWTLTHHCNLSHARFNVRGDNAGRAAVI
jgi:hypothetical protein